MFKKFKKKNIPLILLNARLTKKTFKRWMKIKKFCKIIFLIKLQLLIHKIKKQNFF